MFPIFAKTPSITWKVRDNYKRDEFLVIIFLYFAWIF